METTIKRNRYSFPDRASAEAAWRNEEQRALTFGRAVMHLANGSADQIPFSVESADGTETFTVRVIRYQLAHWPECVVLANFGSTSDMFYTMDEFLGWMDREVSTLGREYAACGFLAQQVRKCV